MAASRPPPEPSSYGRWQCPCWRRSGWMALLAGRKRSREHPHPSHSALYFSVIRLGGPAFLLVLIPLTFVATRLLDGDPAALQRASTRGPGTALGNCRLAGYLAAVGPVSARPPGERHCGRAAARPVAAGTVRRRRKHRRQQERPDAWFRAPADRRLSAGAGRRCT